MTSSTRAWKSSGRRLGEKSSLYVELTVSEMEVGQRERLCLLIQLECGAEPVPTIPDSHMVHTGRAHMLKRPTYAENQYLRFLDVPKLFPGPGFDCEKTLRRTSGLSQLVQCLGRVAELAPAGR